ncbi:MAG TPA: molybdopterin-dependent oxidoreductase [Spirochaetota bacterium]|nr:molybdopterin-dependent oxidoreductase [Spirochaetota bacterium]
MDYKSGVCNFCGTGCGNYLNIQDGKVSGVFSSRNHPVSKGRLCVRGWHFHELLRTDQRISSPMIKVDGNFKKAGYEEAVNFMMEKMAKYSSNAAESTAFLASPRSSNENNYLFAKLARSVFKTNNITLDSESGHRSSLNVLNDGAGFPGMTGSLEEISKTKFILVVGSDITKMNPIIGSEIHKAQMAGTRVVTVSSLSTQIAKLSDTHLQIKPGSKKVLLAALVKAVIDEGLIDADFVTGSTEGYNGFATSVNSMDLKDVHSLTGIDYDSIVSVARELSSAESAMAFWSTGISGLDPDTVGYIYNLLLITGKMGKENCGANPITGICNLQGGYDMGTAPDLLTGFQKLSDSDAVAKFEKSWGVSLSKTPGKDLYKMLADKNSGLKCLVVADHDEGIIKYAEEIDALEFVVYIGTFDNPFAKYADVVIPVAGVIEDEGTYTNTERRVQLSRKRVESFENVLPGWKLFPMIAAKASLTWKYNSSEDVFKEIASLTPAYSGMTYEKIEKSFGLQWPCNEKYPEGCRRLDGASIGRKFRFAPVTGPGTVIEAGAEYPILLLAGQGQHFWHQNNIMKKTYIPKREYNATLLVYPMGYIEICKEDAAKLQVREHWNVKIVSSHGSMTVAVKISEDVKTGTAYVPYFIRQMISSFLLEHNQDFDKGEDAIIPIRIERI